MSVANILGEDEIILDQYLKYWTRQVNPSLPAGPTGPVGETGEQGPQGITGPPGFPGPAAITGAFAYYYSNYTSPVEFGAGQAFTFSEIGCQRDISIVQGITSPYYVGGGAPNVPGSEITLKNIGNYLITFNVTLSRTTANTPFSYIVSVVGALGTNVSGSEVVINNSLSSQLNYNNTFPPGLPLTGPFYTNVKCTINVSTSILNTKLMIMASPVQTFGNFIDGFTMDPFCNASVLIRQIL
jgi:hypothetical protein